MDNEKAGPSELFTQLRQDLRLGARRLLRSPGTTALCLVTLALGIGANTAIFTVAHRVLLTPLPYKNADRTVYLWARNKQQNINQTFLSYSDVIDYRTRAKSFQSLAAYTTVVTNLTEAGEPERIEGFTVTTDFFSTLGAAPLLGQTFSAEDDRVEFSDSVIISYGLWQRKFGGQPSVLGRVIKLDMFWGNSFRVIGIMPPDFAFPQRSDLWIHQTLGYPATHDEPRIFRAIALLKPGVTPSQAQSETNAIAHQLALEYPNSNRDWDLSLVALPDFIFGNVRIALLMLLGAVVVVLLIACINIANLQIVRALSRRTEMAVRTSLGASPFRIFKQLLTESLMLSISGGLLGLLVAFLGMRILHSYGPQSIPHVSDSGMGLSSYVVTGMLSLLTGVLFGLVPALYVFRADLNELMKEGSRSMAASAGGRRMRDLLIAGQIALALILLFGAGVLMRSFARLQDVNPGFDPANLLTLSISLSRADYPQADPRRTLFFAQALKQVASIPGVASVGAISHLPLGGRGVNLPFAIDNNSIPDGNADLRVISPEYFAVMKIPLMRGRTFTEYDHSNTQSVVVVNESFARIFFPGANPLGRHLSISGLGRPIPTFTGEIVGIVGDVKHRTLEEGALPEMYICYLQDTVWPVMNLVIRTNGDPAGLVDTVRRQIQSIDSRQPLFNVQTMDQLFAVSTAQRRFNMILLVCFATLALAVTTVGIFGSMSYSVSLRSHEMALRGALGARPVDVLYLVIRQGMTPVVIGMAIGLLTALALASMIKSLLFEVNPIDVPTLTAVLIILGGISLVSCYMPARKATKVDPILALRHD